MKSVESGEIEEPEVLRLVGGRWGQRRVEEGVPGLEEGDIGLVLNRKDLRVTGPVH